MHRQPVKIPEELATLLLFHVATLATLLLSHFPTCALILQLGASTPAPATASHLATA